MKKFITGPEWDERIVTLNPKRKIGVLMSSGMDSTTLFKLLWDNFPTSQIRIFNVQTSEDPEKPKIQALLEKLKVFKVNLIKKRKIYNLYKSLLNQKYNIQLISQKKSSAYAIFSIVTQSKKKKR